MKRVFFLFIFFNFYCFGSASTLFKSIDSTSLTQLLAFYELYPETKEGLKAKAEILKILNQNELPFLPDIDLSFLIKFINDPSAFNENTAADKNIDLFQSFSSHLPNRKLKGYRIQKKEEIFSLPANEIDLCKALFLAEEEPVEKQKYYETLIDLMALQVLAKLPENPKDKEKIDAINNLIFHQMRFKYPPHSLDSKNIDTYTFLPTVMDNRKGVCLGLTVLYLCIAQRLNLTLEAVTPPGHIFPRYKDSSGRIINIETTARGVDFPTEIYQGIETLQLPTCNLFEVIGFIFKNRASEAWGKNNFNGALQSYKKALKFLPDDPYLNEFIGYIYLFLKKDKKAVQHLKKAFHTPDPFTLNKKTIIEDFFEKKVNTEGIQAVFMQVDETRESILEKQQKLLNVIKKHPNFRAGLFQLAGTYLQLGKFKNALYYLKKYDQIHTEDPTVNYYLSIIYYHRYDFQNSWNHLKKTKKILKSYNHFPKALNELEQELRKKCLFN